MYEYKHSQGLDSWGTRGNIAVFYSIHERVMYEYKHSQGLDSWGTRGNIAVFGVSDIKLKPLLCQQNNFKTF
jgi:hypothetical protein